LSIATLKRVGVTDTLKPSLKHYLDWLAKADGRIEIALISHFRNNLNEVEHVDGLVLTGGGDIDPLFFDNEDCDHRSRDINRSRDEFEFKLIERALERELPILGICRGMQVMNVFLGGTLILDLPSAGFGNHSEEDKYRVAHPVAVTPGTLLSAVTGASVLEVNSSHHQAVDKIGSGLMVSATSPDGVIEGAEWAVKDRAPYLSLVQWHPERMQMYPDSPASRTIAERFLENVKHSNTRRTTSSLHLIEK
jgi:putative glutamine amidotransferase